jgi:UDP-glucose 4-epimerase
MNKRRIMVIGGDSSIGAALRTTLPKHAVYAVRRKARSQYEQAVERYTDIDFTGMDTVINCVGVVSGSATAMTQVNAILPSSLAIAAKKAGVNEFIHISSFAVYGLIPFISGDSHANPVTDYGRSKLAGDVSLLKVREPKFQVKIVRVPIIVNPAKDGKLSRLLSIWRRTGFLPIPRQPVRRAMISIVTTAAVLTDMIGRQDDGIFHAAESEHFEYRRVAAVLNASESRNLKTFSIPDWMLNSLSTLYPRLTRSLYKDSILGNDINYVLQEKIPSDLRLCLFRPSHSE